MKDRTITLSLLGILITLFIIYFFILHYYFINKYPMNSLMDTLIIKVGDGNWVEAEQLMEQINESWNKLHPLLALNYAEADYSMFIEFLGRLDSDINEKNADQATSDASAAQRIWENFVKVVPQP